MATLLILLIVIPLVGAALAAAVGPRNVAAVRNIALVAVLVNLALTAAVLIDAVPRLQARPDPDALAFPPDRGLAAAVNLLPLGSGSIQFAVGLDGLNVWLIALTSVLMLPSVLISW